MRLASLLMQNIKKKGLRKTLLLAIRKLKREGYLDIYNLVLVAGGLIDFYLNPWAKKQSKLSPPEYDKIKKDLEIADLTVIPYRIDIEDFKVWLKRASFPEWYRNSYGEVFIEKALEHYVGPNCLI